MDAPEVIRFEARPFQVEAGEPAAVVYAVAGEVDRLELTVGGIARPLTTLAGVVELRPEADLALELLAEGPGGHTRASGAIRVGRQTPVDIVEFALTPTVAQASEPLRVTWSTAHAASVALLADGNLLSDDLPAAGAQTLRLARSQTISLRAEGFAGPAERSVAVRIGAPALAIRAFDVSPLDPAPGQELTAAWAVEGATLVLLEDLEDGNQLHSGSEAIGRWTGSFAEGRHPLLLRALSTDASRTATATVVVSEQPSPVIRALDLSPTVSGRGGMVEVSWRVELASAVQLDLVGSQQSSAAVGLEGRRFVDLGTGLEAQITATAYGQQVFASRRARLDETLPSILELDAHPTADGRIRVEATTADATALSLSDDAGALLGTSTAARDAWTLELFSGQPATRVGLHFVASNVLGQTRRFFTVSSPPRVDHLTVLDPVARVGRPVRFAYATRSDQRTLEVPGRVALSLETETGTVTRRLPNTGGAYDAALYAQAGGWTVSASVSLPIHLPPAFGATEMEPNDGFATAHVNGAAVAILEGEADELDRDAVMLGVASGRRARVELSCPGGLVLEVHPLDDEEASLERPVSFGCGAPAEVTTLEPPLGAVIRASPGLPAGTPIPWRLDLHIEDAQCGDGVLDFAESCDDGGRTAGDGCDSSCQLESEHDVEPNDLSALGNPLTTNGATGFLEGGGLDRYRFQVAEAGRHRFGVSDPDGVSCSLDLVLTVNDASGIRIYRDDGGGLGCPQTPALALSPGVYEVVVAGGQTRRLPRRGPYAVAVTLIAN